MFTKVGGGVAFFLFEAATLSFCQNTIDTDANTPRQPAMHLLTHTDTAISPPPHLPEHRVFEQLWIKHPMRGMGPQHRLRTEQRQVRVLSGFKLNKDPHSANPPALTAQLPLPDPHSPNPPGAGRATTVA